MRIRLLIVGICLIATLNFVCVAKSAEPVRARLEKDSAWTGEPVPLVVMLYSPGPFSGTASFDLPELPKTVILSGGSPVVGNETIGDEDYFTQRHEFKIFTQRSGEIVIPSFTIQFNGKPDFLSDPEPMSGQTEALQFQSKRPPGTETMGVVIAAKSLQATQTWRPGGGESVLAGELIQRDIEREATNSTAMMMVPLTGEAPDGVRTYLANPTVEDRSERGESSALRRESIKYQFERPGKYELPEIQFAWWDINANELRTDTLPGLTVNVTGVVAETEVSGSPNKTAFELLGIFGLFLLIALGGWLIRKPATAAISRWKARRDRPESVAARRLEMACKQNDPNEAYQAAMQWRRAMTAAAKSDGATALVPGAEEAFSSELEWLSKRLFGAQPDESTWSGLSLLAAYRDMTKTMRLQAKRSTAALGLAPLNPSE